MSENVLRSRSHLQLGPTGRIAGRKAILTRDASSSHRVWVEVPPPIHGRAASATIRAGNRGMLIVVAAATSSAAAPSAFSAAAAAAAAAVVRDVEALVAARNAEFIRQNNRR